MTSSRLHYVLRVRDLVHGYVYLTRPEVDIINHRLFQRLRHVRQNDVAFFVYPSLNISRFEHSLGCAHVSGKMAENLFRSAAWSKYKRTILHDNGLQPADFIQVCRIYALLHDIGHLPLSHLFELAFDNYIFTKKEKSSQREHYANWFGVDGFAKLHEACGAAIAPIIINSVELKPSIKAAVIRLMSNKTIPETDPLYIIKLLIDSDVDADRIDSTARDGLLAGQEYGNYDIERLCSSVFIQKRGNFWRIAYSHKAIGSIEGLLLDRCRTHTWIHFHHRVVSMKVAAAFLIADLLAREEIKRDDFEVANLDTMALRDDVWLWSKLRNCTSSDPASGDALGACIDALLYRDNTRVTPLWKNRTEYQETIQSLRAQLKREGLEHTLDPRWFPRRYDDWLSKRLGIASVSHWLKFKSISGDMLTPLTDESGRSQCGHMRENSLLIQALEFVLSGEPSFYIVCLGSLGAGAEKNRKLAELRKKWIEASFEWISQMLNAKRSEG